MLVVNQSGKLFGWGLNNVNQVCDSDLMCSPLRRISISLGNQIKVTSVSAGEYHSMALTQNGQVFTWGMGNEGQLGNGKTENAREPQLVLGPSSSYGHTSKVCSIACGARHSMAILEVSFACPSIAQQLFLSRLHAIFMTDGRPFMLGMGRARPVCKLQ